MSEKTGKSLVAQGGHSLVVHRHDLTWGQLDRLDEAIEGEDFEVPTDFPENASEEDNDRIADALDTPDMYKQLSPEQLQALDRIIGDFNRSVGDESPRTRAEIEARMIAVDKALRGVAGRLATLVHFDHVPRHLVLNRMGRAVRKKDRMSLTSARCHVAAYISGYQSDHDTEPAQPIFEYDDFGRLTQHVLTQTPAVLTAATEKNFQVNGDAVDVAVINAFINEVLEKCRLWDRHRNEFAKVNSRIVTEVRCYMARKLIASGQMPAVSEAGTVLDQRPMASMPAVNPLSEFAACQLELARDDWTSSAQLWAAWQSWCEAHGLLPGAMPTFFKNLCTFYGGKISPSKRRTRGGREPGYVGVRVQYEIPY
jgi:hypothetical protein